jgi:hypothetical protein
MNTEKTPLENESQPSCLGAVIRGVYSESVYRNKVDHTWIVVVESEISKTHVKMRGGSIWSKNRLARYWQHLL